MSKADISARITELREAIAGKLLAATIREVNSRVGYLQGRADELRRLIEIRAQEFRGIEALAELVDLEGGIILDTSKWNAWRRQYPRVALGLTNDRKAIARFLQEGTPAGVTGMILRDYRGKNAEQVVFKTDTQLLSELRAIERQAAEELGQWRSDEPGVVTGGLAVQINVAFVQPAVNPAQPNVVFVQPEAG